MTVGRRRVVITGIGAITPIGCGAAGLWQGVLAGKSAIRTITRFDPTAFRSRVAAEVDGLDWLEGVSDHRARRLDRYSRFAVGASTQAARDAGLGLGESLPSSAGCSIGSALGGVAFAEEQHVRFLEGGMGAVSPALALSVFGGAAPTNVAIELGLKGPSMANANSCASGTVAIGEAFRLVRDGRVPLMLAGGVEAPLAPLTFGSFAAIKAMSTANACPASASRPFDARRDGFVMAEGAGMLVLEDLEHARARNARRPYAEVLGYAMTNDAHNMLAPLPDGDQAARAICLALEEAGCDPANVDYVNAHASATVLGDRAEAAAIPRALGTRGRHVPVSGTKGLHGHPLGASGGIETAITALALCHRFLPGTANFVSAEPEQAEINVLPPRGLVCDARVALKNSFGFGGINAALVLARLSA